MTIAGTTERERVREIVRRWGWNGTSYQILNPGFQFWIDPVHDAAVGFVARNGVRVVGGGPVCSDERLGAVMHGFEADSTGAEEGAVYFCAEDRLARLAADEPRRMTFPIGAQPTWQPDELLHAFSARASLRAQLNRALNKRVSTHLLARVDGATSIALQDCLDEWVGSRSLPPLHFLVETETLDDLIDRRVFIAERDGDIVAYLVATPIPARRGWLIEQIVRGRKAPNGTAELLLHHAAGALDEQDARIITLGLAPLAARGAPVVNRAPRWLRIVLGGVRSHGNRFYNFEGLEAFKSKFGECRWDPVYASLAPGTPLPRALLAITSAFGGQPLWRFGPQLVGRAVARESRRLIAGR